MNLQKALEGFLLHLKSEGYSPSTVELYRIIIDNLSHFLSDPDVSKITYQDLQRYMVYLQEEYVPRRFGTSKKPLSGSSMQNHWKGIRCFFNWAKEEFNLKTRPDTKLKMPSNNPKVILPFYDKDIRELLKAAEYSSEVEPRDRKAFRMRRRTATRDTALLLLMLDTGLRCGEVSRLNIRDVNMDSGEILVAPFGNSRRKTKSRAVYVGKNARRHLWRYLATRKEYETDEPLFLTEKGQRMGNNAIRCLLDDLGKKAGVQGCHPHRFRHTFAIEFLRGGGDVFSLQRLLGHASLTMVQHYLALASTDVASAHKKASPGDKYLK